MTAAATCSVPGCTAVLNGSSRGGRCLEHWAAAATAALANEIGTLVDVEAGLREVLAANRAVRRP